MGFVSEQKSIGKDQISSCERRDSVPGRLRRWYPRSEVENGQRAPHVIMERIFSSAARLRYSARIREEIVEPRR
jgi:hypothetical protein